MRFTKLNLNKPQDFWNNELWTNEKKVELFGLKAVFQPKLLIPAVKHGGGWVIILVCRQP